MTPLFRWCRFARRCLVTVWLGLGLAGHAHAQTPGQAPSCADDCPPDAQLPTQAQRRAFERDARDHGFLWRISKDGRSSYLFGTIHVAKVGWSFPGPQVKRALQAVDTLALELDPLDPDIQRRLSTAVAAQRRVVLPAALAQRLQRQAQAECVPAQMLAPLSPEIQLLTLLALVGRRDGLDPAYGIDNFLADAGRALKMPVVSLETPELQWQALAMPTEQDSLAFIEDNLPDLERGTARTQLLRLAQVWADGDLDTLNRYESWCDCVKTDAERALLKRLLDDRNPAMAAAIDALHRTGKRVFSAVGSLHMAGPLGLPTLLAQRGYQVDRVAYAPGTGD